MINYFAGKVFRPRLIPTVITLLLLPVLLRLGFWQLERAEEKQVLLQQFETANRNAPLDLIAKLEVNEALNYRSVKVTGSYDKSHTVFHENQVHNQVPGYHVLVPLKITKSEFYVLVNLGWVAITESREKLPDVEIPEGMLTVDGKLKLISEKTFTLGNISQSNQGWPALVQWINLDDIRKKSGLNLHPFIVLLDEKQSHGFVRKWVPVVMLPEKSISYAVQWFSLALALLLIYLVVNMRKVEKSDGSDDTGNR